MDSKQVAADIGQLEDGGRQAKSGQGAETETNTKVAEEGQYIAGTLKLFIYLLIRLPLKVAGQPAIESHGVYYIQATHLQTKFRVI